MRNIMIATAAFLAFAASEAAAQACIGVPARDRQFDIAANFEIPQDSITGYGAEVTANLAGPLSVGASAMLFKLDLGDTGRLEFDDDFWSFGARAAYEATVRGVSVCPTVGIQRLKYSSDSPEFNSSFDVMGLQVPVGVGVGSRIELTPGTELMLFAIPQVVWQRVDIDLELFGSRLEEKQSDTNLGGELGLRLGTRRFFAGASVAKIWMDEPEDDDADEFGGRFGTNEAVLRFTLGVTLGGAR